MWLRHPRRGSRAKRFRWPGERRGGTVVAAVHQVLFLDEHLPVPLPVFAADRDEQQVTAAAVFHIGFHHLRCLVAASPIVSGATMVSRPPVNIRRRLGMGGRKTPSRGCPSAPSSLPLGQSRKNSQCHSPGNASGERVVDVEGGRQLPYTTRGDDVGAVGGRRSPVLDVADQIHVGCLSATHLI
jgi:hypothetical protein